MPEPGSETPDEDDHEDSVLRSHRHRRRGADVLLFVWIRRSRGVGGGVTAFGRSRAQRVEPSDRSVNFEDVAGKRG
jgi:hypothetical protein